jgi:FtsZ-binding cell division protein ZapB
MEEYRERSYRLSIENDLLKDKVDTYEQLVDFMRNKYKALEKKFDKLKVEHRACQTRSIILYR